MTRHRTDGISSSYAAGAPWGETSCCARAQWKPVEIAATVLGFVLFWPLGLAILIAVMWRRSMGYSGDVFGFAREQASRFQQGFVTENGWRSGNVAFDEWREAELARLEAERRKLADAEREFAEHMRELRRARDREEFESFMRARKGGAGS
jgi:hypothetical protein